MNVATDVHPPQRHPRVLLLFSCECGYLERWPIPPAARVGRCTCPRCGGQLHKDDQAPPINSGRLR